MFAHRNINILCTREVIKMSKEDLDFKLKVHIALVM